MTLLPKFHVACIHRSYTKSTVSAPYPRVLQNRRREDQVLSELVPELLFLDLLRWELSKSSFEYSTAPEKLSTALSILGIASWKFTSGTFFLQS